MALSRATSEEGVMTAAGLGTRWEAAEAGIVLLGTPTLQEDGAGRISLGVTPQGERLGCPHCRAPALPPGRGRTRPRCR